MKMETIYKGFLIKQVYNWNNGKGDFQVYSDEGRESGSLHYYTTLEDVMESIDESIEEITNDLILSLACELLKHHVETFEAMFRNGPSTLSTEDWDDYIESARFLEKTMKRKNHIIKEVENYLLDYK